MDKKTTAFVKKTAQELLKLLEVEATPEAKKDKEDIYHLDIKTSDPGILIGYHGETLSSFQLILSLVVYKKTGTWQKIIVDAGDYRQKRAEALKKIALNTAQKVKFTGKPQILPHFNSAERRLIHLCLADHPEVVTESQGEGSARRLVVKPKE